MSGFRGEYNLQKFHLDKILNGGLVIIVDFNMSNIWKTLPDRPT